MKLTSKKIQTAIQDIPEEALGSMPHVMTMMAVQKKLI